ncbi:hypothetical protein CR164_12780 [Prosthecochloris marina]|uniref:TonB-dependent siderophore receptor n=1 Tax=Prosthecochloris marina TaxID=2017681 RepID=A0A317T2T6_9CHLB|nr:TonB-dependent receptor [Prosthecochloris marina]PWW80954.1 hypothetical protein CR164_12780 [Prosthecochloris marina]
MSFKKMLVAGLCFFLPQLYSGCLLAEDDVLEKDDGDIRVYEASSITVTAQKREESVQKVPAAITAITETELEDAGVETIADVIDMIPNLSVSKELGGFSGVAIRGIGPSMFTRRSPVVIYVDGVPYDDVTQVDLELLNVERIEVLRGPQGTLYGKNAIGGVINVITRKPGNDWEGKASVWAGEHETYGMKGFVNGPVVTDRLFFSVSGKYTDVGGYMKNDHPDQEYFDARSAASLKGWLRWLPVESIEVNLHARVDGRDGGAGASLAPGPVVFHGFMDPEDRNDSDVYSAALDMYYQGKGFSLYSLTTYLYEKDDLCLSKTFVPVQGTDRIREKSEHKGFTQELRVQSPDDASSIRWMGGLYYSTENTNDEDYSTTLDTEGFFGYNVKYNWPGERQEQTVAAFGQVTFPLVSALDFTAGLRYETIRKELDYRREVIRTDTGQQLPIDPFSGSAVPVSWSRDEDWGAFLPKGVLSWGLSEHVMLYGSVARGYLAGGLNAWGDDKEAAKFDEQTSLNYEVGAKMTWLEGRVLLNATLFYIDIENMHVWNQTAPGVYVASNAAKAHSQGVEVEARAKLLQGLDIGAAFGLLDAKFDEYGDFKGNVPVLSPDWTANFNVQYRHGSGLFVRMDADGYGTTYYDDANTIERDPFGLVHAKIGYEADSWDVYLYGNNLLDKEYFTGKSFGVFTVGEPRTVGMTASVRM